MFVLVLYSWVLLHVATNQLLHDLIGPNIEPWENLAVDVVWIKSYLTVAAYLKHYNKSVLYFTRFEHIFVLMCLKTKIQLC